MEEKSSADRTPPSPRELPHAVQTTHELLAWLIPLLDG
jgi:hypothetical protein